MSTYYCPNCGQEISPHIAHNPKGSYMEAICQACGIRIIGASMKGWITDITVAQKQRVTYREILPGSFANLSLSANKFTILLIN